MVRLCAFVGCMGGVSIPRSAIVSALATVSCEVRHMVRVIWVRTRDIKAIVDLISSIFCAYVREVDEEGAVLIVSDMEVNVLSFGDIVEIRVEEIEDWEDIPRLITELLVRFGWDNVKWA